MAGDCACKLMAAGKVPEMLGVPRPAQEADREFGIQPDDLQRGCEYYGPISLGKLRAELKKR